MNSFRDEQRVVSARQSTARLPIGMNENNIMILGAGVYQVPLIKRARAMGLRTIVLSTPGPYPGVTLADRFLPIDTTDVESVLRVAREFSVKAVCTTGTDVCLPSLGAVVDACKLCGPGYDSACRSMDKTLMKEAFIQHDVPTAQFQAVTDLASCRAAAAAMGYPVMVKAVDSSGSRGVTMVASETDLPAAWERARAVTRSGFVLVEEYLHGIEYGAQVIIHGNQVKAVIPHRDKVTPLPYCTPVGHSLPTELSDRELEQTRAAVEKAVAALGLCDCIANADLMLVNGEPKVLEIGGRMGATCLPECISLYRDFDAYTHVLQLALGEQPDVPVGSGCPNAAFLLSSRRTGVVRSVDVPEEVRAHPNVVDLQIDVQAGDRARAFQVGPDRIGHLVVTGDSAENAESLAERLAGLVVVNVDSEA